MSNLNHDIASLEQAYEQAKADTDNVINMIFKQGKTNETENQRL